MHVWLCSVALPPPSTDLSEETYQLVDQVSQTRGQLAWLQHQYDEAVEWYGQLAALADPTVQQERSSRSAEAETQLFPMLARFWAGAGRVRNRQREYVQLMATAMHRRTSVPASLVPPSVATMGAARGGPLAPLPRELPRREDDPRESGDDDVPMGT